MFAPSRAVCGLGVLGVLSGAVGCARTALTDSARAPVPIEAARVENTDLLEVVDVVGTLAPKLRTEIKSEYSGTIAAVDVREWVTVHRGQALARLDSREAEAIVASARAAVLQAKVAETRAERELTRAENLKEAGLLTRQGLDDARTAHEAAVAGSEAARAQLAAAEIRLAKTVIRAPFDGVVAARNVNVGDRVENMGSNTSMFEIVDNRQLDLTMTVPSSRLPQVSVDQAITFTVDALPDRSFEGRITHVNPSVDPRNRAGRVVATVSNEHGALKGGLFAKARISVGKRTALQVPRTALQQWDVTTGTALVFVIEGDTAKQRAVKTGLASGDAVEVADGLARGETVATRGAFSLRGGDRVRVVPPTTG